jgi:hypothetical protein
MKDKMPITTVESPSKVASVKPRLEYAGTRLIALVVEISVVELVTVWRCEIVAVLGTKYVDCDIHSE